jgi:hypothetical protein
MEKAAKTLEEFAARRQAESTSTGAPAAQEQEGTDFHGNPFPLHVS